MFFCVPLLIRNWHNESKNVENHIYRVDSVSPSGNTARLFQTYHYLTYLQPFTTDILSLFHVPCSTIDFLEKPVRELGDDSDIVLLFFVSGIHASLSFHPQQTLTKS